MSRVYIRSFRTLYRFFASVNGAGERHEYTAALTLSLCMLLNVSVLSLLSERWFGVRILVSYDNRVLVGILLAVFLLQYLLVMRRESAMAFIRQRDDRRDNWSAIGTLIYVFGSVILFLLVV